MVVADMVADKKREKADMELDMVADMVAGYGCWLIGPKLFRPEAYPACVSSKLCEFIFWKIMIQICKGRVGEKKLDLLG